MKTIQQFFEEAKAIIPGDQIEVQAKISNWVKTVRFTIYSSKTSNVFDGNTPEEALDAYLAASNGIKVDMEITPEVEPAKRPEPNPDAMPFDEIWLPKL